MNIDKISEILRGVCHGAPYHAFYTVLQAAAEGGYLDEGPVWDRLVSDFGAGRRVFVQTVTFYYVGELVAETAEAYYCRKGSWVRDAGEDYGAAIATGEVQTAFSLNPNHVIEIRKGATVACLPWDHQPILGRRGAR